MTSIKRLSYVYFDRFRRKKLIKTIRENWGKEVIKERKFDLISIYHKLKKEKTDHEYVDNSTWTDLNMDSIFSKMDRNISPIGSQYLYHILHVYEENLAALDHSFQLYNYFLDNQEIREKILVKLCKLRHNNANFIPTLIFKEIPQRPKFYLLIYLTSFLALLSIVLILYYPVIILASLFIVIINLIINHFYGRKVFSYFVDISYLSTMLKVGLRLSELNTTHIPQIECLKKHRSFAKALNKKIGWLVIDKSSLNEMAVIIIDYFNYFCLFNIVSFIHSIQYIRLNQDKLKVYYETIASLDASISIASYLKGIRCFCKPNLNNTNTFDVKDLYHPLLENPVSNSLKINNKSCLITGSNMAGKTTFIKTIGVNIILAQSLSICLAKESNLPKCIVKSSIRREDNINENISNYYREIESILEFIQLSSTNRRYLFLIDEIFRGTNTIERISASTSVLKYLANINMSMVTTHDIELQDLLDGLFEMYHFSEQVKNEEHYFDYLIKSGPCSSRNAIKLLELKGYPEIIVKNAYELAKKFS